MGTRIISWLTLIISQLTFDGVAQGPAAADEGRTGQPDFHERGSAR
jgi:hypothetical protein